MRFLAAIVVVMALAGCALPAVQTEYVQADVQFEALFAPLIAEWMEKDSISDLEKRALAVALQSWRAMVKQAADANQIPHKITVAP